MSGAGEDGSGAGAAGAGPGAAGTGTGPTGGRRLSRRGLLVAGGGVGAAAVVGGVLSTTGGGAGGSAGRPAVLARVAVPRSVAGLPSEQHAWDARLAADADGNAVAPRHQRLLLFTLAAHPTVGGGDRIERALRLVEAHAHARAKRLVMTLGWGPAWFRAIGEASPVPEAVPLSETEAPTIDTAVACLHLGSDDPALLDAIDRALTQGRGLPEVAGGATTPGEASANVAAGRMPAAAPPGDGPQAADLDLRGVLTLTERRLGFVGDGLPRQATGDLEDASGVDVREASPLFMGFKSGMRRNQATEPAVTIDHGRWMGGSTMHVSRIALTLPSWYRTLSDEQRTLRMHGPGVSVKDAFAPGDGLTPPTSDIEATARKYGVVGHTQAAAVARKRDRPLIIRRDFNGVEHGQPVTHFVALARSIDDFVATRKAMNADRAVAANPQVGAQVNNGINEWLAVKNRANYLVPPRAARAFPGLRPSEGSA